MNSGSENIKKLEELQPKLVEKDREYKSYKRKISDIHNLLTSNEFLLEELEQNKDKEDYKFRQYLDLLSVIHTIIKY